MVKITMAAVLMAAAAMLAASGTAGADTSTGATATMPPNDPFDPYEHGIVAAVALS